MHFKIILISWPDLQNRSRCSLTLNLLVLVQSKFKNVVLKQLQRDRRDVQTHYFNVLYSKSFYFVLFEKLYEMLLAISISGSNI